MSEHLRDLLEAAAERDGDLVAVPPRVWSSLLELAASAEQAERELLPADFRTASRQPARLEQALSGARLAARLDLAASAASRPTSGIPLT